MIKSPIVSLTSVKLTLLSENTACGAGICGEHGLSWWIESAEGKVLFDLGQGLCLKSNAKALGINLSEADAIVFSHGHYDHVGGWWQLPEKAKASNVFLHPAALVNKYQKKQYGGVVPVSNAGFPAAMKQEAGRIIAERKPTEVIEGIWMTGEIPRVTDYEDSGGAFYLDKKATEVDPLDDDQSLFFKTSRGLVVVLGCAHAGVVNTLLYVQELTGESIHAVVGGMHLLNADDKRLNRSLEDLELINPDWIAPNHCTGAHAVSVFENVFKKRLLHFHAGQNLSFPRL